LSIGAPIPGSAGDDTLCKKTGKQIPGVGIALDPMSPPFPVNLHYGLRFVQVSVLVSPVESPGAARALPLRFDFAPPATKPKKNAAPETYATYKNEKKQKALPAAGLAAIASVAKATRDEKFPACRWVFHPNEAQMKPIQTKWAQVTKECELDGLLFHNLWRTAVRNMVRAGIAEKVAMRITGHKTRAFLGLHNIITFPRRRPKWSCIESRRAQLV